MQNSYTVFLELLLDLKIAIYFYIIKFDGTPCLDLHRLMQNQCPLHYHGAVKSIIKDICFFNMKAIDSKLNSILNLVWISSSYFNPFVPNAPLLYPLKTSVNLTSCNDFVFIVFLSYLFSKSVLSLMLLFTRFEKSFNKNVN